jgi:hypothetical protein
MTLLFAIGGLAIGTGLVAYFGFSEVACSFTVRWTGFFDDRGPPRLDRCLVCCYLLTPQSAAENFVSAGSCGIRVPAAPVPGLDLSWGAGRRLCSVFPVPWPLLRRFDLTLEMIGQLGYTASALAFFRRKAERSSDRLDCSWHCSLPAAVVFILVSDGLTVVSIFAGSNRWAEKIPRWQRIHRNSRDLSRPVGSGRGSSHFAMWGASGVERGLRCVLFKLSIASVIAIESALCNPPPFSCECLWPQERLCLARYVVWLRPRSLSLYRS